eukprot:502566-Rhodomonas_salina.2
MGSVSVASSTTYTPGRYLSITTLHNDRSKLVVYDDINNFLYTGTLNTSVWEVSFHLRAGSGTMGTNYGCGDATQVPGMRDMKWDDIVPDRAWALVGTAATLVLIDIGATEICISAAYEGTYNSNFLSLTSVPLNGYIYTSFNEKSGEKYAHVFKVDLFADPPDWSDYGQSTSIEALVDDSQMRHQSSTCLFNGLHCFFIDQKIATFNMHTGADLGVVNCGGTCAMRGWGADWFDSSPWRLAIIDFDSSTNSNVIVKDYAYTDCLPDEYLWGTGRDVTCL